MESFMNVSQNTLCHSIIKEILFENVQKKAMTRLNASIVTPEDVSGLGLNVYMFLPENQDVSFC